MRKVIVGAMVSMDGVMQAPGGPEEDPTGGFKFGGWTASLGNDPVFDEELGKLFGEPFDLLLGRLTYDIFAAYWPYAEGGPADDIAKTFNRITKYVATRKGVDLKWQGSARQRQTAVQRGQPAARVQTHAQRRLAERAHRRDLRSQWRSEDRHHRRHSRAFSHRAGTSRAVDA
jgi:dihydrofolate reductase